MDGGYQISKAIRESCVFARHDVTKDPPFSHLDLVSCRNVLIYLDAKLHRSVLPVFHYALNETGLLLLGGAETTAAAADLFTTVDKQHHIYRRRAGVTRFPLNGNVDYAAIESAIPETHNAPLTSLELQKRVDRVFQSKYSPAAVLVDAELQILQFRGHTSPYLDPTPGEASLNLLRMARESLVLPLRRSIQAAAERNVSVRETEVVIETGPLREEITLEVTPVTGGSPENAII